MSGKKAERREKRKLEYQWSEEYAGDISLVSDPDYIYFFPVLIPDHRYGDRFFFQLCICRGYLGS